MFTDDNYWLILKNREIQKENSREKRRKSILKRLRKRKEYGEPYNRRNKKISDYKQSTFAERDLRVGNLNKFDFEDDIEEVFHDFDA